MKLYMIGLVSIVALTGCSPSMTHANTANDPPPLPKKECYNDKQEVRPCDNFDAAGNMVGNGARYVYDESVNAWHWLSSTENKERASRVWDSIKDATNKTTDALRK